jgi:poly(3-hydroxybutyrate) depolymerase
MSHRGQSWRGKPWEKLLRAWYSKALLIIFWAAPLACAGHGARLAANGTSDTLISRQVAIAGTLSVKDLRALLHTRFSHQSALQRLLRAPVCAVIVYKFLYATVGGQGEATDASGALMVPAGTAARCRGSRPILLYAHGTSLRRTTDMSAVNDPTNPQYIWSTDIALAFATQGYIVIAPNYAGYDLSTLPYHPYFNAAQQSQDAIDSLTAGRQLLRQLGRRVHANGQLFVSGYSEGGFVAMATLRALDMQDRPATAGAPMSGPYARLAFLDEIFLGHPNGGRTAFLPMELNSYAHLKHGSIDPTQILSSKFQNATKLFPGKIGFSELSKLVAAGDIPATAVFQSESTGARAPGFSPARYPRLAALPEGAPLYGAGFDPSTYLISTAFRAAYIADVDAHPDGGAPVDGSAPDLSARAPVMPAKPRLPLRRVLEANDLRNYTPTMPLLMCGGHGDPTVFWDQSTAIMTAVLESKVAARPAVRFATLDLDISKGTNGTYVEHGLSPSRNAALESGGSRLQAAFTAYQHALDASKGTHAYHYHIDEEPYCMAAARTFFEQY